MTSRVQGLRLTIAGNRPTGRQPGEIYVNWPDRQLGVINQSNAAQDLVAVRYWSQETGYNTGDHVIFNGSLYYANTTVTPNPFAPAQWTQVGLGGISYLPLNGGTMLGSLFAAADPVGSLEVATKNYVDTQGPYILVSSGPFLPVSGGTIGGALTVIGPLSGSSAAFTSGPIVVNGAPGVAKTIVGQSSNNARWDMMLGDTAAETGANAGANFALRAWNDAGAVVLGTPLTINRATGITTLTGLSAPQVIGDNRIINGDCMRDQRNAGGPGTATNVYTVDRWLYAAAQVSKGTWQRGVSLAPGFPYSLTFTSTSAYTSLSGDTFSFSQPIEADQVSDFAWGTAGAQPVTLSFWAQSTGLPSYPATFSGCVFNYAATRSYPFSYSIAAANTWTKVTITIPGDTGGTWVMSGNVGSMWVSFDLGAGSTFRGPANAWATANYRGVTGSASIVATNGAVFRMTGVKLELGPIATTFNRNSMARNLADCQRYYQGAIGIELASGCNAISTVAARIPFPVAMRATPTIVATITTTTNITGGTVTPIDATVYRVNGVTAAAGAYNLGGSFTASAEL